MRLSRFVAVAWLVLSLGLASTTLAASNDERNFLAMYFSDEELAVFSATRSLKSVASVAENVAIVTAADIEIMNAHTVAEALYNITGIEMENFKGPGAGGNASIHGAGRDRVLVLLDGVPLSTAMNTFELAILPVQMVMKIEVIKGPAASTWGSSFGGVINVITKSAASGGGVGGTLSASFGKSNTTDIRAEAIGRKDGLGIYLYGGKLDSDGLRENLSFSYEDFFGKVSLDAGAKTRIDLSLLYNRRDVAGAEFRPLRDVSNGIAGEMLLGKTDIRTAIADNVVLTLSGWWNRQDDNFYENQLSTNLRTLNAPTLFERYGFGGNLAWATGGQAFVVGAESSHDSFKQEFDSTDPMEHQKYALFVNDSITVGDFNVSAGLRYDSSDLAGEMLSPSVGATFLATRNLLFRANIARGFHNPAIVRYFDAPSVGYYGNEQLTPERIWSYQAGLEANVADVLRAKLTLFYHDIDDVLLERPLGPDMMTTENGGRARTTGGEVEFSTNRFAGFVFSTGGHYEEVRLLDFSEPRYFDVRDVFGVDATLAYDGKAGLTGALKAHYLWWDMTEVWMPDSKGIVVDVSATKKIFGSGSVTLDLFAVAHNLFNAHSYRDFFERNPGRWLEAGVRCTF